MMKGGQRTIDWPSGRQISPWSVQVLAMRSDTDSAAGEGRLRRLVLHRLERAHEALAAPFADVGVLGQAAEPGLEPGRQAADVVEEGPVRVVPHDQVDGLERDGEPTGWPEAVKPWGNSSNATEAACSRSARSGPRITAPMGK
jgi:hypothetical protein